MPNTASALSATYWRRPLAERKSWISHIFSNVETALAVRRERRELRALPDYVLKDLGLSRADVAGETIRPFWDVPNNRLLR